MVETPLAEFSVRSKDYWNAILLRQAVGGISGIVPYFVYVHNVEFCNVVIEKSGQFGGVGCPEPGGDTGIKCVGGDALGRYDVSSDSMSLGRGYLAVDSDV